MTFLEWLGQHGGICTLEAALDRIPREQLDEMRGSTIWSPLRGWVAQVGLVDERTTALQRGGVVSCVSALVAAGVWVPSDDRPHIRIRRGTNSARAGATEDDGQIVTHRLRRKHAEQRPATGTDDLITALAVASTCIPPIDLVTVAGDAVAKRLIDLGDLHELANDLPRAREALLAISGDSESCSEARLAEALRRARIRFRQQVAVLPDIRVDFLIGRRLIVECDSRTWHGGDVFYERDRRRDARLAAAGYIVIRVSYQQIMHELDSVLGQIRTVLASRALR